MRLGFEALRLTIRWLPLRAAQVVGRVVGAVAYGVLGRYRRLTWAHLRLAFGSGLSEKSQRRIARRVFVGLGKTVMEWWVVDRFSPARLRRIVEVHGLCHLDRALAKGRGVIALSAHFGNWELLAITLAGHGYRGGVLARPLRYPEYEQALWGMRARKGVATVARGSLKDVTRVLRDHQIIGMMTDQDTDSLEGVFVEFFDRPAYTPVGPAALSLATGAPIVPCFLVRMGGRFRLTLEEPITIERTGDRARDLVEITQAWSRVVETYLRRYPDQWVWMHERWKTSPQSTVHSPQLREDQAHTTTAAQRPRLQPVVAGMAVACALLCTTMVGCGKIGTPPVKPAATVTASASGVTPTEQQQMDRFTVFGYAPDGAKRWELTGRGAIVEGDVVTIQRPDAIGYDVAVGSSTHSVARSTETGGRTVYLTATLAQVNQTSRRVRMEHDATLHTSDGVWMTSPVLYWLPDRNEMATDQPVRIESARMLLRGIGATGQAQLSVAKLLRDVEMVLSPSADAPPGEPASHATITCDGPLAFDYERNIAIFELNVHVKDREGDLYSDKLVAYLDGPTRTIRYAEATGRVRIVNGPHTAHSARAVYEPGTHQVTLLGAPSLWLSPDAEQAPGSLLAPPLSPLVPLGPKMAPAMLLHVAQDDQREGHR